MSEDLRRSRMALVALAAWVGVESPDQLPDHMDFMNHPNDLNRKAWERVAAAIEAELRKTA